MKRRDFLKSVSAVAAGVAAPAVFSPAKAQSRQETLLIVSESGPNNLDIHGVGTNVPGYEVSWNCYDRLISHEMKTGPSGQPYYDKDKFKPELAEDMNIGDMSVTFKLKKNATFQDGTPVTAKDVKWSLDRAVTVGGFPTFQMGAGSLTKPEQFVAVDDHTVRVDFMRKDRLTIPDLAVIVPCVVNSELVKKHATEKDPWGLEYTKQNTAGSGAYKVTSWTAGSEIILERNDKWVGGPLPKTRRIVWRMVPSAGNRRALLERGDADISYELPNKDFVELKDAGKLSIVSTPFSNGCQYLGMNVTKPPFDNPKVRQAVAYAVPYQKIVDAVLFGLAKPLYGATGADRSRVAAAAQDHDRHGEGEGAARRGRLSERLRDHAVVRSRLCDGERAALPSGAGEPRPDRHQVHDQQDPRRELPHRAEQEGAAALHQRVLGLARLSRVLLHLVLSRQEFDLQHDELPVQGDGRLHRRRRDRRRGRQQGRLREGREGLRRSCLCRHAAHPAVPALLQRRDAEEHQRLSVLVPPPAGLSRAGEGVRRGAATMLIVILKRLLIAIPSLIGVVIVTFLLTRALPGDPAAYFAGPAATKEAIQEIRVKLGLDKSLPQQFIRYVGDLAKGDLGQSLTTGQPVVTEIRNRLPASAELTLLGLIVSVAIAIPLGIFAAVKPNSWVDHTCRVVTTAGVSLPVFFTGLILVYVFYYLLGWAPAPLGRLDTFVSAPPSVTGFLLVDSLIAGNFEAFRAALSQLFLPAMTLGIFSLAPIARMTRASMLAVLASDFVRTARASGLTPFTVIVTYAFRNAMLPVVTTLGMVFSFLLGANVLVEKVFAWPGIGSYAVEALIASDFAPVQGFVLTMAIMYVRSIC